MKREEREREMECECKTSIGRDSIKTDIIHTNIHKGPAGLAVMPNFLSPGV